MDEQTTTLSDEEITSSEEPDFTPVTADADGDDTDTTDGDSTDADSTDADADDTDSDGV
jgi:hypothetical protein